MNALPPHVTDARVHLAAQNNAAWCSAVCTAHGDSGERNEAAWIHATSPPRYYPNAVTLDARPQQSLPLIEKLVTGRSSLTWSVKDSFAALDLTRLGGTILFRAEWLWREPCSCGDTGRVATRVRTKDALARWEQAWCRANGELAASPRIFLPELLTDENAAIIALSDADEPIHSGVIAYRAADVVGVHNMFGPRSGSEQDGAADFLNATGAATRVFPGLPVVTYRSSSNLASATQAGFTALGALSVWVSR